MEFGMFHEFQCPPGQSEAAAFAESFEQADAAERWGLDVLWLRNCTSSRDSRYCRPPWLSPAPSPHAPAASASGPQCRCCRSAIRCVSPRKSPRSTISATGG